MATGMPVVSTNVGGVPYVVLNEECGLLSSYTDVEIFMKNIYSLLTDVKKYELMVTSAKKAALRYIWNNISKEVTKVYNL